MHGVSKVEFKLKQYLPTEAIPYVIQLMREYPCKFVIAKPRKTKLGDYRKLPDGKPQITVNGDLNIYSFLITTIHEFAHLIAFEEYGRRIKPHGSEWQKIYRQLMLPVIDLGIFPKKIENALVNSLINVKASSCSDTNLFRVLSEFDPVNIDEHILEELNHNQAFELNGKYFFKGNLRRSRFVCMEMHTQKVYLVHALARVKKVESNE